MNEDALVLIMEGNAYMLGNAWDNSGQLLGQPRKMGQPKS